MLDLVIDLGWKSALIAGVALSGVFLLGQGSAGQRVVLLRAALAALLALPLFAIALPALELALLPPTPPPEVAVSLTTTPTAARLVMTQPSPGFDTDGIATFVYGIGAVLVLGWLAIGLWTLRRWTRAAAPLEHPAWRAAIAAALPLRRPVRLRVSHHAAAPLSWGVAPAWILIDRETAARPERAGAVIAHELAHVRRFDWPVLVAAQAAAALYWFNPLVWLLVRELARQTEHAADEVAVRQVARADYAQTLLAVANRARTPVHANGMALSRSQLARRIAKVLDGGQRRPARPIAFAALIAGGFAASAPLAAMKLVPAAAQDTAISPMPTAGRSIAPARSGASPVPAVPAAAASVAAPVEAWETAPPTGASPDAVAGSPIPAHAAAQVPTPVRVPTPVTVGVPVPVAVPIAVASQSAPVAREAEDAEDVEEGRREAAEGQREAAQELREQAAEMYRQANELERNANETGQPAEARQGMLGGVRGMRDAARGLEAQAAKLAGN